MYKQALSTMRYFVVVFTVLAQVSVRSFGQDAAVHSVRLPSAVLSWIRSEAMVLPASNTGTMDRSGFWATHRIIGLGEATHGHHEAFDLKRRIIMQLIRDHGFRTVAYEASASKARVCNDHIEGLTDDSEAAMR
jgi:erythromycin esterase-like protein